VVDNQVELEEDTALHALVDGDSDNVISVDHALNKFSEVLELAHGLLAHSLDADLVPRLHGEEAEGLSNATEVATEGLLADVLHVDKLAGEDTLDQGDGRVELTHAHRVSLGG
jgi:hypothetical protein